MKKIAMMLLCLLLAISFSGCTKKAAVKNTIEGNMKTYYEMTDGTWMCEDRLYKYRLEIDGRMPNAAVDSSFVYLSNLEEITFDQAYQAAGISSNSDDYFSPDKAVLVEMN
ncbi:MAG: immunogenic protein [Clostridia bacterium]|nr:immunogenic protein [Clostridia bacterium]MBR6186106.1 immunogenic protein [Clostridia bacterium]